MTTATGWQAAEGRAYGGPGRYVQRAGELASPPTTCATSASLPKAA